MGKIAIVDCRAENKTVYSLEKANFSVVPTIEIKNLYDAVATHADMQIHYIGDSKFVCAPETFNHYRAVMPSEFDIICGSRMLSDRYPNDIAYNTAVLADFIICNPAYTASEIIAAHRSKGKEILSVKQGYSKCSTCIIGGNAIITSDSGIAKKAEENDIDVLRIQQGHIKLRRLNYGFIGGATGLLEKNVLAVNGDINTHPDSESIKHFCKKHGTELFELKDGLLEDIGTLITNIEF
jgi:hypothetical protein